MHVMVFYILIFILSTNSIGYIVIYPDGGSSVIEVDLSNAFITIDGFEINILYNDDVSKLVNKRFASYNVSSLTIDLECIDPSINKIVLEKFNAIHVQTRSIDDWDIELYYDKSSNILIYAYLENIYNGETFEIKTIYKPTHITTSNTQSQIARNHTTISKDLETMSYNKTDEKSSESIVSHAITLMIITLIILSIISTISWLRFLK